MTGYIYKITNPNGKIYIGKSIDIEKRKKAYSKAYCEQQKGIYASIKKYGWDVHTFEILEECDINQMNIKERFYQDKYNVLEEGLNLRLTKTDERSGAIPQYVKDKISEGNRGRKMSEEEKQKRREIALKNGNKPPSSLGRKRSEETRLKMSLAARNRKK